MKEKHDCAERIWTPSGNWGYHHYCAKPGKVQIANGAWLCTFHSPESVKRREDKRNAKYDTESKQRSLGFDIQAAEKAVILAARTWLHGPLTDHPTDELGPAHGWSINAGYVLKATEELEKLYAQRV